MLRVVSGLLAVALAAISLMIAWGGVFREDDPVRAQLLAPWDAQANTDAATRRLLSDPSLRTIGSAVPSARASLARQPIQAAGLRLMGTIADAQGHSSLALSLMRAAEQLSRRDLLTELWLIEHLSQSDDIDGVLRHYEIALSGRNLSVPILYPVLIAASDDPAMIGPMSRFLVRNRHREWRNSLLTELITKSPALRNVATIALGALDRTGEDDVPHYRELIDRLIPQGEFDLAFAAYRQALHAPGTRADTLRDPEFTNSNRFPPFDWLLTNDGGRGAQAASSKGQPALSLSASPDSGGAFVRQLVRLSPGRYRFSFDRQSAETAAGGLVAVIGCAPTPSSGPFVPVRTPVDLRNASFSVEVEARAPCAWYLVGFDHDPTKGQDDLSVVLSNFALKRRAGAD